PSPRQCRQHRLTQAGTVRETHQPSQPFAGKKNDGAKAISRKLAEPGENRGGIRRVENAQERTAKGGRALLLQHGGELFELPAFGEGNRAAFETGHGSFSVKGQASAGF